MSEELLTIEPPEDLKPVEQLKAEDLLHEQLDYGRYRTRDVRPWVKERIKQLDDEVERRLHLHDQMSNINVESLARCLGVACWSLWHAHGGRELTKEEQSQLHKLLFDFYVKIN